MDGTNKDNEAARGKYRESLVDGLSPVISDEAASALTGDVGRWDFFFRAESNRRDPASVPAKFASMELPLDTPLCAALGAALDARLIPQGTHRSGCFEVQTDAGIFTQVDGKRIDLSTARRAAKVTFRSWEELEREEEEGI